MDIVLGLVAVEHRGGVTIGYALCSKFFGRAQGTGAHGRSPEENGISLFGHAPRVQEWCRTWTVGSQGDQDDLARCEIRE